MSGIGFRRGGRQGPFDAGDWRHAIWNRWLISYLTPRDADETEHSNEVVERVSPEATAAPEPAEPQATPPAATAADTTARPSDPSEPVHEPSSPDAGLGQRPSARARLDSLLEQVFSLEATVDSLVQRTHRTSAQERLEVRRTHDALDRIAELQERHTDALLSCTRALERLERRMMSLERHALSRPGAETRPSVGAFHSEPPRMHDPDFRDVLTPSGRPRPSATRLTTDSGQAFHGNLGDLSVPTLLSMFELERRTGSFEIETDDQQLMVMLDAGKLVTVTRNGLDADLVEALGSVIEQRHGRFAFTPLERTSPPPDHAVTVGTVLLRISQKSDEEKRVLYAT
jgi:Domain of unknown function (DUF4388)